MPDLIRPDIREITLEAAELAIKHMKQYRVCMTGNQAADLEHALAEWIENRLLVTVQNR